MVLQATPAVPNTVPYNLACFVMDPPASGDIVLAHSPVLGVWFDGGLTESRGAVLSAPGVPVDFGIYAYGGGANLAPPFNMDETNRFGTISVAANGTVSFSTVFPVGISRYLEPNRGNFKIVVKALGSSASLYGLAFTLALRVNLPPGTPYGVDPDQPEVMT